MTDNTVIAITAASKRFGAVNALDGVDFAIGAGEVLGLVGHNGAGKSTLVNVIAGTLQRDDGTYLCAGAPVPSPFSPRLAHSLGIRCVFQELSLCPNLDVIENTRVVHRSLSGFGWRRRAERLIRAKLDEIFPGNRVSLRAKIADLPIAQRQMIEVARAFTVTDEPLRLVILDEPTSALGDSVAEQLTDYIAKASAEGISIILITHRLNEILATCHRVVVMVDGRVIANRPSAGLDHRNLVGLMGNIQRHADEAAAGEAIATTAEPLVVWAGAPASGKPGASLIARPGEIIGLAGLDGHGQTQALRDLMLGARRHRLDRSRADRAFVAGDRHTEGVFPVWSIAQNLTVGSLKQLARNQLLPPAAEQAMVDDWVQKIAIRTPDANLRINTLSGGNQQKVLFARALASTAQVILLDDPMRGVDVGTKLEVYRLVREEAARGRCFLWYTTELDELKNCHRAYVFHEGRIVASLSGAEITAQNIIAASFAGGIPAGDAGASAARQGETHD